MLVFLLSDTCPLTLTAVVIGGLGSFRHSQADLHLPKVHLKACRIKNLSTRSPRKNNDKKKNPIFLQ